VSCSLLQKQEGSIFGQVSEYDQSKDSLLSQLGTRAESELDTTKDKPARPKKPVEELTNRDLRMDPEVIEFTRPKAQTAVELLLSPLKRQLYERAVATGGYSPNQLIELDGKKYKLNLGKEELQVLEPSVFLQSYRIKSSTKKTYVFLRMLRGLELKKAITQCHFSAKGVSRDVGEMLARGIGSAKALGLDPDNLYVEQIWVGKDGQNVRRLDAKGRGRTGIITHKWVHVKAILRELDFKNSKEAAKVAKVDHKKVWQQLASRNIRDHPQLQEYKW